MLSFRVVSGRTVVKSLAQVAVIQLAGDENFNRAETLARAGKLAEAVAAYNAAAHGAGTGWKKALIGYRLVKAAETGGKTPAPAAGPNQADLKPARLSRKEGKFAEVVAKLAGRLTPMGWGELPSALYLLRAAQSRLATLFAATGDAPEAPLVAGKTNNQLKAKSLRRIDQSKWSRRDATLRLPRVGETERRIQVFGIAAGSAGVQRGDFALASGGSGAGPKSRFFGTGGNAHHIVYAVDRSGSMLDTFDEVRNEIFRSITRLGPTQTFHVIFFSSGDPKENPPRRLVQADVPHKREAVHYLRKIQPHARTEC